MLIDALTLPDDAEFDADLAIIGSGPAGMSIALAFANTPRQVCLLEAGGLAPDGPTQALYDGENVGIEYSLVGSRLRYFGGSSGHWGGFCRPLDAIDFEQRDWVPHSGWPFARTELEPYFPAASEILEIAPARFEDGEYWREMTGEDLLDWRAGLLHERFFQYSPPTRFGARYRGDLEAAANVRVLLNANVTNIAAAEDGQAVKHLLARTLSGKTLQVRARQYVLAAGGLENPRILLFSNDVVSPGLGNQNDLVGRFFMEHPHQGGFAEIVIGDLRRFPQIYYDRLRIDGRDGKAALVPTPDYLRRGRLLNASFTVGVAGRYAAGVASGAASDKADSHVRMLGAAGRFLGADGSPMSGDDERPPGAWLGVGCASEQAPNPDSRVTLTSDKDVLGLPKLRLDWRLSEQDRRSFVTHVHSLGRELGAMGLGRALMNIADDGRWPERVDGGNHHMGTTRMHDDPKRGVVDGNCRVHGIDNLYVAGSSVFPTCGSSNPTINIVALALRLADHLQGRLA